MTGQANNQSRYLTLGSGRKKVYLAPIFAAVVIMSKSLFACPVTFFVQVIGFQTANEVAVILIPCCRQERELEREQK